MQWWLVVPKVEKGLQFVAAKVGFWDWDICRSSWYLYLHPYPE